MKDDNKTSNSGNYVCRDDVATTQEYISGTTTAHSSSNVKLSLIAQALVESASLCAKLWQPTSRHVIGYSSRTICPELFINSVGSGHTNTGSITMYSSQQKNNGNGEVDMLHSTQNELDGCENELDHDIENRPVKLEERQKQTSQTDNMNIDSSVGISTTSNACGITTNIERDVQVGPVMGISMKYVDKFIQKHRNSWGCRNMYMFYHISVWRERTAAQYDLCVSYVLPTHLLLEISRSLPKSVEDICKLIHPLPGILDEYLEFFDDGRHVKGVELLLANLLQGYQDYEKALNKLVKQQSS